MNRFSITLILLTLTTHFYSQGIHTIRSQNGKYFLKAIPYSTLYLQSGIGLGKTTVYKSDSVMLYSINRYFDIKKNKNELLISNDGSKVVYIRDKRQTTPVIEKNIIIYDNGLPTKTYNLEDLVDCDTYSLDCYLLYTRSFIASNSFQDVEVDDTTHLENLLKKHTIYINNDTIYIFSKMGRLIKLNMGIPELNFDSYKTLDSSFFMNLKTMNCKSEKLKQVPPIYIPKLNNGDTFKESFAKYFGMQITPDSLEHKKEYKKYILSIEILIDHSGKAHIDSIPFNLGNFSVSKLNEFVTNCTFNTSLIPDEVDKWKFVEWINLMNKDLELSKKERLIEIKEEKAIRKRNLVADSINGKYIPKNIEECFYELNKTLKKRDIDAIKNLEDKSKIYGLHFGLGMWIRNNWGLWGGSRLQKYMKKRGVDHPDSMSGIILSFYYDWLNGNNTNWRKFDKK